MEVSAAKWLERLERAKKKNKTRRENALRYKDMYTGEIKDKNGRRLGRNAVRVNTVYGLVDLIMPTIFAGKPEIKASARIPGREMNAKKFTNLTNYWAREKDLREEFKDCLFDNFFHGAVNYVGWEFKETEVTRRASKDIQNIITGETIPKGTIFKFNEIEKDEPFLRWIDYWDDYLFDPDVKKHRHRRWEAVRLPLTYNEFQEMSLIKPEYKKGGRFEIKASRRPEDEDDFYGRTGPADSEEKSLTSDAEWITIWEIWDKESKKRHYIAEGKNAFLETKDDWPYQFEVGNDPFPCTVLPAKPDSNSPHSISEFQPIEDQMWERHRNRSVTASVIRKTAPKYTYSPNAATKAQMKKFLSSEPMSGNEFKNPSGVGLAPVPTIPNGFFEWDSVLKEDLKDMTGQAELDQGQLANTATEANILENRSTVRKSARNQSFEAFVARSLSKFGYLIQQFQQSKMDFRISGQRTITGQDEFVSVLPEDIQGEFDFEVIPGSMEHRNEMLERREKLRAAELLSQNPAVSQTKIAIMVARALGVAPEELLKDEQEKAAEIPEPMVEVEKVKLKDMSLPDRQRFIEAAKQQNSVQNLSQAPAAAAAADMQQAGTLFPENQSPQSFAPDQGSPGVPVDEASLEPTNT